jgi:hypothetical protein
MSKIVGCFREQKVEKTLIFYKHTHTHTHVSIVKQKKSPMAILDESAERTIRMVSDIILSTASMSPECCAHINDTFEGYTTRWTGTECVISY